MELKTAKQILAEAVNVAVMKGCFNLVEVQNIVKALELINSQPEVEFGEITPYVPENK